MRRLFLSFILLTSGVALAATSTATSPSAAAPAKAGTVRVQRGQTLYRIARAHGLSVEQLMRLNGLTGTTIEVGQVLRVAAPPAAAKAPVSPTKPAAAKPAAANRPAPKVTALPARPATPPGMYRVQKGDTLPKIGAKVGLRVEQLKRLNGLKGDALNAGQLLRLTAPAQPKSVQPRPLVKKPAAPPTTYTVRRGDTLTSIGKFVGLRVEQLQRLNGLKGSSIEVGQVLRLTAPKPKVTSPAAVAAKAQAKAPPKVSAFKPAIKKPAAPPTTYTVRQGDTLGSIGKFVGLRVEQLQRLNGLSGTTIQVGQVLRLTPAAAPVAKAAGRAPLPPGTEARLIYRYVRVGIRDNAKTLAQTYRITPEQLRALNGLGSTRHILPGMRLLVPQTVAVPVPPRPVASPVTLRQTTVLGVPVQVVRVDLRWRNVLVSPVLPSGGLNFGSGATVSTLAARSGARALVNGSYFHPNTYAPAGDIVMQGRLVTWGRIPAALAITPDNRAQIRQGTTGLLGRVLDSSWAGMETVIATGPQIVRGGVVQTSYSRVFRDPAVFGEAARSALGLAGERDLMLVTTHAKLGTVQMGRVMQALGAREALLLDGGSSAGMAWNGAAVLNSVRKVSYGIGVFTGYSGKRYSR